MDDRLDHAETRELLQRYIILLDLPTDRLRATTDRSVFEGWLGRRVRSSIGGAHAYVPHRSEHLIHMRDRLDGDLRRHAKHGHDRIAHRVAALTGASLNEIRSALLPAPRRPARYLYRCPACGMAIPRQKQGTWSCGRCAPRFDRRFLLQPAAVS